MKGRVRVDGFDSAASGPGLKNWGSVGKGSTSQVLEAWHPMMTTSSLVALTSQRTLSRPLPCPPHQIGRRQPPAPWFLISVHVASDPVIGS